MNLNFPAKSTSATTSLIRVIADRGAQIEGFIPLAMGNPAAEAIPTEVILEATREVLEGNPMLILQYGPAAGYAPLRQWIENYLVEKKGLCLDGHSLVMLGGSGQGLGLVPRTLCEEGDIVFTDEFTFPGGTNAIRGGGQVVKGIKMDEYGMIPEELDKAAKQGGGKYVYLIPNFHNPMGMTMPLERRKELYKVACENDLWIYEDDPYGDIRFAGTAIPSFKSFDVENRVILAGSFSKVLAAGIRVGYLFASDEFAKVLNVNKMSDGQAPILNQMIVYNSMAKLDYDEYIAGVSAVYGRKCKVMMDAMRKYCSDKVKFTDPEGGMFAWMELPETVDATAFHEACMNKGVGIVPSEAFATDPENNPGHGFRLNYTFASDEKIEEAIHIMGDLTREFCD